MKPALDNGYYLIICHEEAEECGISVLMADRNCWVRNGLCLYEVAQDEEDLCRTVAMRTGLHGCRYLDRFFVLTSLINAKMRQYTYDRFFTMIARQYDELIEIDRNRQNILNLLNYLAGAIHASGASIVDYGCGTGLSVDVMRTDGLSRFQVHGVDRCPKMRQIAADRGMQVWSPGDLARQEKGSIGGAFASYVFHLLPDVHGVRLLWSRLSPGAILVANFHKNKGIEMINACLEPTALDVRIVIGMDGDQWHGTYVAYVKK
jgi:SAM-dependent methyltransferase